MAYSGKHMVLIYFKRIQNSHSMHEQLAHHSFLCRNLCTVFAGLELSFYSGVYGTCIGSTTHFEGQAKGLIGLSGIVVGIGEIVGRCVWSRAGQSLP